MRPRRMGPVAGYHKVARRRVFCNCAWIKKDRRYLANETIYTRGAQKPVVRAPRGNE